MGRFYDIIQSHIDSQPYGVSKRQIARKLEVSPTTLNNWQDPKDLIEKRHIQAVSRLTGVPYSRVLDALLVDIGYLREEGDGDVEAAPIAT